MTWQTRPQPFGPHTPGRPGGNTRGRKPAGQRSVQFGHAPLRPSIDLWQVPPVCEGLLSAHRGGSCPWSGGGSCPRAAGTSDHTPGSLNHTNRSSHHLEARIPKLRCQEAWFLQRLQGRVLPASSSFWGLQLSLGLWPRPSSPCLCHPMATASVFVYFLLL